VVRCGVDETFLAQPVAPPPATPRLVSIGRLAEQKGQLILIEAASLLEKDGLPFEIILIGDGPMRAQLESAIARHGLQEHVRLAGWMDSVAIRQQLLDSRALVMPSFAEGLPVVLMEALALARPVISTAIAGIPELVVDGVNGWLVPAGSAEALAHAMRTVLDLTPQQLGNMGRAGAEAVAARHNAATEAGKLANLFELCGQAAGNA
jgi:glycosyltransferase involved in cell wall biosynthesis